MVCVLIHFTAKLTDPHFNLQFSLLEKHGVIKATEFWTATNVADALNALTTCIEVSRYYTNLNTIVKSFV